MPYNKSTLYCLTARWGVHTLSKKSLCIVSSFGYALLIIICTTQIWGGIFPFLPTDFQSNEVTLLFYVSQSCAFCLSFFIALIASYRIAHFAHYFLVTVTTLVTMVGALFVIAAMYTPTYTIVCVCMGGLLLGIGCMSFYMHWQRYFSSMPAKECNLSLMLGTIIASITYALLHMLPEAITAFLLPVVMLPLCALCLSLSIRGINFNQPMFEDVPREHPVVYKALIRDNWRSALCVGALAFSSGLARSLAILDQEVQSLVNLSSMTATLVLAVALMVMWYRISVRFSMQTIFRLAYPVVMTVLLLIPFTKSNGLNLFAGLTYAVFSIIMLIMMMQCSQISRERGINPIFIYSFYALTAYTSQSIGFLLGWLTPGFVMGLQSLTLLSLLAAYVLGITLFISFGALFSVVKTRPGFRIDQIELLALHQSTDTKHEENRNKPVPAYKPTRQTSSSVEITDRLSKQCLVLQKQYSLSARETEVMELVARGCSVAAIAEMLFISENTVRTHNKHIYSKLDIHSRQELSQVLLHTDVQFDK